MYDSLPADARSTLSSWVGSSQSKLQPLIDKAMSIPGVGDKLRPFVEPMLTKLRALAGM
jgi:hypothetical protein